MCDVASILQTRYTRAGGASVTPIPISVPALLGKSMLTNQSVDALGALRVAAVPSAWRTVAAFSDVYARLAHVHLDLLLACRDNVTDIEARASGRTAVHWAATTGNAAAIARLAQLGANVHATTDDGEDVDDLARQFGLDHALFGGWSWRTHAALQTRCDFDQVFERAHMNADVYLRRGRPAVFRGFAKAWASRSMFTKDALLTRVGADTHVHVGAIPYAHLFGGETRRMRFGTYVNTMHDGRMAYLFQSFGTPPLMDDFPLARDVPAEDVMLFMGPEGSGASAHVHAGAINAVMFGRKRWFVAPPLRSVYSSVPTRDFEFDDDTLVCDQSDGDVVIVPYDWGHATLNLMDTVGVAVELRA